MLVFEKFHVFEYAIWQNKTQKHGKLTESFLYQKIPLGNRPRYEKAALK